MAQLLQFFHRSDIVVVGVNPEMADMSNPRGERYGESWCVVAENARGDRWEWWLGVDCEELAERQAAALNVRMQSGRLPSNFSRWDIGRPGYGSEAYVEYGQADDLALEELEGRY